MLSPDLAPLVTVLTVVVMANAINLIDGLDGLAAGIVVIAGSALFLYADRLFKAGLLEGSNIAPLVAIIAVGVCLGFLPHNLNPARIIMGDAGALFLGLLMATTTITVGGRTADQFSGQTYFFFAPLFIPIVILGVPILDTVFSFFRRVYRRTAFTRRRQGPPAPPPDAARATATRRSVVILWVWTALLSGLVLFPTYTNRGNAIVPLGRRRARAPPVRRASTRACARRATAPARRSRRPRSTLRRATCVDLDRPPPASRRAAAMAGARYVGARPVSGACRPGLARAPCGAETSRS